MLILCIISYILIVSDLLFTRHWVRSYGISTELNPVGKWIMRSKTRQIFCKLILPISVLSVIYFLRAYLMAKIGIVLIFVAYLLINIYHVAILIAVKSS